MTARIRLPENLRKLLRSQMEQAIYEANLGEDEAKMAKRYFIDRWPQIDIAAEFGCDRSTISKRMPEILAKVEYTAKVLFDE